MCCGPTPIDERPTPPVVNPADDANDRVEVDEVWRGLQGRVFPETIFIFCRVTGFDVREDDSFVLRLMYLRGLREIKVDNALKFTKKGLLDEILGVIIVGIAINEAFVLW